MARSSSIVREEDFELDNDTLEDFSHIDKLGVPRKSSPQEDESRQGRKSLGRLDEWSPVMEDGLPDYDNWPSSTDPDLDNDPFSLTESSYPVFDSGRSRVSGDWLHILQEGNKRYAFRDTDRNTFRGSGFQDLDESGNYVEKPQRLPRPSKIKVRKTLRVGELEEDNYSDQIPKHNEPRTLSYEQGRKNGRSMMLRLNISSERGIESFKALAREHASSHEVCDEVLHDRYRRSFSDPAYSGSKSPLTGRTGVTTRRSAININGKTHDHPYQKSEDTYDNLLGHPEARGCRDCYDLGIECSLIDNCLSYPCHNCQEDEQDCLLITPRNEKRVCEHCKSKKLHCSFGPDSEEDSLAACDNCQDANVICIAGPAKSYRIDDVLASIGSKGTGPKAAVKTQYPFCTVCRKNKIRSSAANLGQNLICRQCLIRSSSVSPETSPESVKVEKKRKAPPKRATLQTRAQLHPSPKRNNSSRKQGKGAAKQKKVYERARTQNVNFKFDSDLEAGKPRFSASVPGGKVMYVTTSFCHPIQFNWIPPPPLSPSPYSLPKSPLEIRASSFPCHFCTDPGVSYAIAGLGIKRVEVIQWQHDQTAGYEELEGGWVEAGQEGTRMCARCTMERIMICLCTDHLMRPIKGLDPRTFDYDGAMQGLVNQILSRGKSDDSTTGNAADVRDVKWCSICPQPAFFECCVRPAFTSSGRETSPSDDIGCGLLLCEVCASRMGGRRHQHRRSPTARLTPPGRNGAAFENSSEQPIKAIMTLDEHINAAAKDTFHYHDGLRADVCFLKVDGELMRRQGASADDVTGGIGNEDEIEIGGEGLEYDEFQDRAFKKRNWGMGSPIDLT